MYAIIILYDVQMVTSHELMPRRNNELKWTSFPKVCRRCLGVKRKRIRTENVTSKSYCGFSREVLPRVALVGMNTECSSGKDRFPDPVSTNTSLPLTANMSVYAGHRSGRTTVNDAAVCASITTAEHVSTAASNTTLSTSNRSRDVALDSINKAPQSAYVRPLFKNSVFHVASQLKQVGSPGCTAPSVEVTAAADMNRDVDLHQCPLCDMVFDFKYVMSIVLIYWLATCKLS